MKVEQAKQIASDAIEQLRHALEVGQSDRLEEYLAAIARFRHYSWGNVMLIASQKPNATHVAAFGIFERYAVVRFCSNA
jgi:glutamate mutase epsilon subunit